MGKRGPQPKRKVQIRWSRDFAYAVGLLTSDGCLSPDGRHIIFVSKDLEQLENFTKSLKIRVATRSSRSKTHTTRVQFGDVIFYQFLQSIGLMPNKSKVIGEILVPGRYFFDFLRGVYDGDGCSYSYFDPRWKSSFLLYTSFASASPRFIEWIQKEIQAKLDLKGHISGNGKKRSVIQLRYASKESIVLLRKLYENPRARSLRRKRLKIERALRIMGERLYPRG